MQTTISIDAANSPLQRASCLAFTEGQTHRPALQGGFSKRHHPLSPLQRAYPNMALAVENAESD